MMEQEGRHWWLATIIYESGFAVAKVSCCCAIQIGIDVLLLFILFILSSFESVKSKAS